MSRRNKQNVNEVEEVNEVPVEEVQTDAVEAEETTVEEPKEEETVVQPEPQDVPEPVVDKSEEAKEPVSERDKLVAELGISNIVDNEGNTIAPSTPVMRMMKRYQEPVPKTQESVSIEELVSRQYPPNILENQSVKYVIGVLSEYTRQMSPNVTITEDQGAKQQQALAHMLDVVLALDGETCQICLDIIVSVIRQNLNLCFSDRLSHRFANAFTIAMQDAIRFQTLLTTLIELARGTTKKDLPKKISVRKLLDLVSNRNAKANLAEYLN